MRTNVKAYTRLCKNVTVGLNDLHQFLFPNFKLFRSRTLVLESGSLLFIQVSYISLVSHLQTIGRVILNKEQVIFFASF